MRILSPSQELFDSASSFLPLITQATTTLVTYAHFRISDFKAQTHPLGNSVSLYSFYPMDMLAPAYAQAVAESNHLHIESFTSNRASTTAPTYVAYDLGNHSITDEELRKRMGIESLSEILDPRCMNWMEKAAEIPATLDDN